MERASFRRPHSAKRWELGSASAIAIIGLALLAADSPWKAEQPGAVTSSLPAYGLSFSHPAAWRTTHYGNSSSFTASIAYLSTDRLHDPCVTRRDSSDIRITCGAPLVRLRPGGVLIEWSTFGMPGHRLVNRAGVVETIAGHPARVVVGPADGGCAALGGDLLEHAQIQQRALGSHDQLVEMSACLRGPGVAANQAAVQRMLNSVQLVSAS